MRYFYWLEMFFYFSLFILFRYGMYRYRYFLHSAQLNGYKTAEFWNWIKGSWSKCVATQEYYFIYILTIAHLLLYSYFTLTSQILVLAIAVIYWFAPTKLYRQKQKKPLVYTPRLLRQIAFSLLIPALILFWGFHTSAKIQTFIIQPSFILFAFVIATFIAPFAVLLGGFLALPIEKHIQNQFKKLAVSKLGQQPNTKIIGITGSYGKTSTKFAVQELLKERFSVLATPGSYNTPMGICKVINDDLLPSHQILVLEMGARYRGNIQELCAIATPSIAIVTNVGKAHLETFGSQEAIAQTKAEMIEYMQPGGMVFLNANDALVMEMAQKAKGEVISAGINAGDYQATDITYDENGCSFKVIFPDKSIFQITIPLLGEHHVQNLILSIALAHKLGLRPETIALAAKNIKPVEHRLELKRQGGITIIDDAFNSNPVGAKNAVSVLSQFKTGKRIIITPGMIELGESEFEENKKLGFEIGKAGLELSIFVGEKRSEPLVQGYLEGGGKPEQMNVVSSLFEANDLIRPLLELGDVVLYENDLPDTYSEN